MECLVGEDEQGRDKRRIGRAERSVRSARSRRASDRQGQGDRQINAAERSIESAELRGASNRWGQEEPLVLEQLNEMVGAPPEVAARLSAMAHRLASDPTAGRSQAPPDPELDQFMDLYCDVLIKYQEELTRPLQEAKDFLNKIESQLNMLTNELLLSGTLQLLPIIYFCL
ncbi:hypothetical protein ZIOFF_055807 [Zingiber officinale]|uniref:KNOX2 domain-containing protein n=1 Tax=Zingiber officinale TaxID=94328 RepID=A0A8J5FMS4_ZINOF|nr:hypothetical protein ZIOFF_055807 [Zingiber officinale]